LRVVSSAPAAVLSCLCEQQSALKYAITAITNPTKAGVNPTVALFDAKLGK
jgi:hypothetical protein